ncbi:MAG: PPOX class F420-dependent oxidoreductase [Chloroflexota bacterium]
MMTAEEVRLFLTERPRTAKLATVCGDGRPHVVPIWFDMDGDAVVFTTMTSTVKAINMRRDPRVCLCIDDDVPPFAYVVIDGVAALYPDAPDKLHWTTRIAGKYMGRDRAEEYGRRNAVPEEILVRVQPTKIVAERNIA